MLCHPPFQPCFCQLGVQHWAIMATGSHTNCLWFPPRRGQMCPIGSLKARRTHQPRPKNIWCQLPIHLYKNVSLHQGSSTSKELPSQSSNAVSSGEGWSSLLDKLTKHLPLMAALTQPRSPFLLLWHRNEAGRCVVKLHLLSNAINWWTSTKPHHLYGPNNCLVWTTI
jgi:hypothetical protein